MTSPNAYRRSMLAFGLASVTLIAGAGAYAAHDRAEGRRGAGTAAASPAATPAATPAIVKAESDLRTFGQPEDRLGSR